MDMAEDSDCSVRRSETYAAGGENRVTVTASYGMGTGYPMPVHATCFKMRDKARLSLEKIKTNGTGKAKYTVIRSIGSYSYRLDTPPGIIECFNQTY